MSKLCELPAVLVRWIDSHSVQGWKDRDEIEAAARDKQRLECVTIGFLVHEEKHAVTVVQSIGDKQFCDGITIPRCAITSIKRLGY